MAQRRMLNIDLILDDHFTQDLSPEAQAMYIYLNMLADDDGIVGHLNRQLRMLNKSLDSVDQLVKSGYLLQYNPQTIIIIDWLVNNHIRGDRYTPSREDDCRSALYITYDWRYSLDKDDKKVFSSYAEWIINKRKVNGQQLGQISREELKQLAKQIHMEPSGNTPVTSMAQGGNQVVTSRKPSGNQSATPVSGAVAGTGSGAVAVSGTGLGSGKGKGLGKDIKYIHSSSNEGMGEVSSYLPNEQKSKIVEKDISSLFAYLNELADKSIPSNDPRLIDIFTKLLANGYDVEDVQRGIDSLVSTVKQLPNYNQRTLHKMLVAHLAHYTNTALES